MSNIKPVTGDVKEFTDIRYRRWLEEELREAQKSDVLIYKSCYKALKPSIHPTVVFGYLQDNRSFKNILIEHPGSETVRVSHTVRGGCIDNTVYIDGFIVKVPQAIKTVLSDMRKKFKAENYTGLFDFFGVNDYNYFLQEKFNADCNNTYSHLREGIYPIDMQYIKNVSEDEFPDNMVETVCFASELGEEEALKRIGIFVLSN